ncbi:hypothetical protein KBD71_02075 [Candidatus Woesebacteria bacterium]|nr:hypothetical protein [Candidatus Woesebacteria bacterium]
MRARLLVQESQPLLSGTPEKAEASILFMLQNLRDGKLIGAGDLTVEQNRGDSQKRKNRYPTIYAAEYNTIHNLLLTAIGSNDQPRYLTMLDTLYPPEKRITEDPRSLAKTEPAQPESPLDIRQQATAEAPIQIKATEKMDPVRQEAVKKRILDIIDGLEGLNKANTTPAEDDILTSLIQGLNSVNVDNLPAKTTEDITVIGSSFDADLDKNRRSLRSIASELVPRINTRLGDVGKARIKDIQTEYKLNEYAVIELTVYLM